MKDNIGRIPSDFVKEVQNESLQKELINLLVKFTSINSLKIVETEV